MSNKNHIMMPSFYRGFFDFFTRGKFTAITVSKNTAWYLTFDALDNKGLHAHEEVHMDQYERHGWLGFVTRYVLYSIRYGYRNNPFEIEAREISKYG
jgi:hypothetical protein